MSDPSESAFQEHLLKCVRIAEWVYYYCYYLRLGVTILLIGQAGLEPLL